MAGTARDKAQRLPTPEDVRRIEGVIVCSHTREQAAALFERKSRRSHIPTQCPLVAGSDVVLRSRESVGCRAADITILSSGAHYVVFRMRQRVHVAAAQDCGVDALVYAAFVAYCAALSGVHFMLVLLCRVLPTGSGSPYHSIGNPSPVTEIIAFEDFRLQMIAAGWSLSTHQLRLGDHVLHSATVHLKSS